jgi:hypothetical protein
MGTFVLDKNKAQTTYEKVQLYDRKMMNHIWINREKLFDNRDKTQLSLLKSLYDGRIKGQQYGKRVITYKLSSAKPGKLGYGRYYGGDGSLETLEQDIRATLCSELYTDIDIVNCHPTLIVQYAKRNFNLDMPYLENYVNNRQLFFSKMYDEYDIEESTVKNTIIIVLYNGAIQIKHRDSLDFVSNNTLPKNILEMKREMKQLYNCIKNTNEHTELYKYLVSQDKNIQGSFLAYIIQTEERRCLEAMIEILEDNDIQVDVLSYDGCMTRGINNINDALLKEVEKNILNKTGYHIQLKIKPMIPIKFDEDDNNNSYEKLKKKWEVDHFYFKPTNTIVEMTKNGLIHYNLKHAMEAFNNWLTNDNELFLKKWRTDCSRRVVEYLVYKQPEDCLPNEASLFTGFAYTDFPYPSESEYDDAVNLFCDLVSANCDDDPIVIEYVMKTYADMLQNPFRKTGVCIIFSSKIQGVGKDTTIGVIRRIIGNHTAHYIEDTDFWNNHDTKKEGAILMYLEEACAGSNKAKSDALKARITADSFTVNPKGMKMYDVPNIARYFMTTNSPDPVKIEESDRRFLLINPSTRLLGVNWGDIQDKLNRPSWMRAIAEYLLTIDLTGWNSRIFPITDTKKDVMDLSSSAEKKFLEQWVCDNPEGLVGKDLYKLYKDYCINEEIPYALNSVSFCIKIMPYKNVLYKVISGKKSNKYYCNMS